MVCIAEEEKKEEKEEGTEEKVECPTCGAKVASDATECPECGEKLGEEEKEETEEEAEEEDAMEEDETKPSSSMFYAGILVFLIGIALAFGSWLHYAAKWPNITGHDSFGKFGPSETAIAIIGVVIFFIGLLIVGYSMKKPASADEEKDEEAEDEEAEEEDEKEADAEEEEEEKKKD